MFVNVLAFISFLKLGGSEQGNAVRNNVVIGVSGAEGLSSPEVLTPSGVYVQDPSSVVEASLHQEGQTQEGAQFTPGVIWSGSISGVVQNVYLLCTGVEKL